VCSGTRIAISGVAATACLLLDLVREAAREKTLSSRFELENFDQSVVLAEVSALENGRLSSNMAALHSIPSIHILGTEI
jgi:hypothetical protein